MQCFFVLILGYTYRLKSFVIIKEKGEEKRPRDLEGLRVAASVQVEVALQHL